MAAYTWFTVRTTAWRCAGLASLQTFILTTSPYYVIRTQFRRQANSADNKAATVAVDSLLNYEAVKVRTRHSSRVRIATITHIEFQQRAVRGRTVRYALAHVREGVGQDSYLSCAPKFGPERHLLNCAYWNHVPRCARCH